MRIWTLAVISALLLLWILPLAAQDNPFPLPVLEPITAASAHRIQQLATLDGHEDWIMSAAFSPNGKYLATGSGNIPIWMNADSSIRYWDLPTGEQLAVLEGHELIVNSVEFSPDGKLLASASGDGTVRIWDVQSHTSLALIRLITEAVTSATFSPDGSQLATSDWEGDVYLWEVADILSRPESNEGTGLKIFEDDNTLPIWNVTFSPDGHLLASGHWDGTIRLMNAESGEIVHVLEGHNGWAWEVAFSPDGNTLVSGGYDGTRDGAVKLWDVETGEQLALLTKVDRGVNNVAFNHSGSVLAISYGLNIALWDMNASRQSILLAGLTGGTGDLVFGPDDRLLVSVSDDLTIHIWGVLADE